MTDPADKLKSLHALFCDVTGNDPNVLRYPLFERAYYEFDRQGFTCDDLRLVVAMIIRQNRTYSIKRKLTIRAVIEDLPRFCEDLAEARRQQSLKRTPREVAMGELRGFVKERDGEKLKQVGEMIRKAGLVP